MINLIYVNFNHLNDMLNVMKINLFINYCSKQQQFQIIKYQSIMLQLTGLSYTIEISPNCFKWSVQLYNIYYDIDIYIYIYIIFFTDKLWIEFLNWKKKSWTSRQSALLFSGQIRSDDDYLPKKKKLMMTN